MGRVFPYDRNKVVHASDIGIARWRNPRPLKSTVCHLPAVTLEARPLSPTRR
jgi:hypothetical protein